MIDLALLAFAACLYATAASHWPAITRTARTLYRDCRYLTAWWRYEHHRNPKGTR